MKRIAVCFVLMLSAAVVSLGQDDAEPKSLVLTSTYDQNGKHSRTRSSTSCFNFTTGKFSFGPDQDICFGNLRVGDDWDWFSTPMNTVRTRLVLLGKKTWQDDVSVAYIEPWSALAPGEQRHVKLDASGADGRDGSDGLSGASYRGNIAESVTDVREPENDAVRPRNDDVDTGSLKSPKKGEYFPYMRAQEGRMYALRVVDATRDFYVLFRVDEIERGMRCVISWKIVPSPAKN